MDSKPPLFSIVVVHYQGTVSHEIYRRGIQCLQGQTFKDFEILCYHDGPLLDETVDFLIPIKPTPQRFNDWGHSLRDIGIHQARGEYIIHFNVDNILYPDALELIAQTIALPGVMADGSGMIVDTNDIILFPIVFTDHVAFRGNLLGRKGLGRHTIFNAHPPTRKNIDCLQLVMKRDLWITEGGWSSKAHDSDGVLYERFCYKYGYRTVSAILGEHH
jgi:hypothetical protein